MLTPDERAYHLKLALEDEMRANDGLKRAYRDANRAHWREYALRKRFSRQLMRLLEKQRANADV